MKEKNKKLILLIVICICTLGILFGALKINEIRNNEMLSKSVVSNYLHEIKYDGLNDHIVEEPNTIIYVSNSSKKESIKFEKKFKKVIEKYNLESEIVFININNTYIIDPIYQNAPNLIFYSKGELNDIVDCTNLKTKKSIIKIFEERGIIND